MTDVERGYKDYFERKKYNNESNLDWLNGWTQAEKDSRGGHFDQLGRPSPIWETTA